MFRPLVALGCLLFALSLAAAAHAEESRPFAVLPFTVHGPDKYAHLGPGIQSMLNSRLSWEGKFIPLDKARLTDAAEPDSVEAAVQDLDKLGVDYLIWGSVTILGDDCSLDIQALERGKELWARGVQTTVNELIPTLEQAAKDINAEVFLRQPPAPTAAAAAAAPQSNPYLVASEDGAGGFVFSPGFAQPGAAEAGRWRSQSLPFISGGMAVGDINGDGANEVVLFEPQGIHAFVYEERKLREISFYKVNPRMDILRLSLYDVNNDGRLDVVVSAMQDTRVSSFVLRMDKELTLLTQNIPYQLNVVSTPPNFRPTLVGQKMGLAYLFDENMFEMLYSGDKFIPGNLVPTPRGANIFNICFLPQEDGHKVILVNPKDHLQVFSSSGSMQYISDERFAGSSIGIEIQSTPAGMTSPNRADINKPPDAYYFLPMEMVPHRLNGVEQMGFFVNRNISVAAEFFRNYRSFTQGEINYLYWDGIGLSSLFRTRRIKGNVFGYTVADIDGDGREELVVGLLQATGLFSLDKARTVLTSYQLDLPQVTPVMESVE